MMKEKFKKVFKNSIFIFVLGVLVSGVVGVCAVTYFPSGDVTYDNSASGLQSTDVQGAIDELYNACEPKKEIIMGFIPADSEGIYKDSFDNIRYYGANPNNYISFNNELWRIIGVFDGQAKIIRKESIGYRAWASNGKNNWNNSDLKSYLNGAYYNSIDEPFKNMISKETFFLGGVPYNQSSLLSYNFYLFERGKIAGYQVTTSGNPTSIEQYIGLMYPSDYGYAAGESCLSTTLNYFPNSCKNSDYLFIGRNEWTQMPDTMYSNSAVYISTTGQLLSANSSVGSTYSVRPTLYLSSDVQITGGAGTESNPYTLS